MLIVDYISLIAFISGWLVPGPWNSMQRQLQRVRVESATFSAHAKQLSVVFVHLFNQISQAYKAKDIVTRILKYILPSFKIEYFR